MEKMKQQLPVKEDEYLKTVKGAFYDMLDFPDLLFVKKMVESRWPWYKEELGFERIMLDLTRELPELQQSLSLAQWGVMIFQEKLEKENIDPDPKTEEVLGSFERLVNVYHATITLLQTEIELRDADKKEKSEE